MADEQMKNMGDENFGNQNPQEPLRLETPNEKITVKFEFELAALAMAIVVVMVSLFGYFGARQQLYQDFAYVSVGNIIAPNDSNSIAKGMHIASTRGCQDCHGGNYGGTILQDNFEGRFVAPNLTNGKGSATYNYFDENWVKSIKHGIGPDNKALVIMPSADYNTITDSDLLCLIAYLKQLPSVDNVLPKTKFTPFTYIGIYMGKFPPIAANVIDHSAGNIGEIKADTTESYGQYISFSCSGCHGNNFHGAVGPNLT